MLLLTFNGENLFFLFLIVFQNKPRNLLFVSMDDFPQKYSPAMKNSSWGKLPQGKFLPPEKISRGKFSPRWIFSRDNSPDRLNSKLNTKRGSKTKKKEFHIWTQEDSLSGKFLFKISPQNFFNEKNSPRGIPSPHRKSLLKISPDFLTTNNMRKKGLKHITYNFFPKGCGYAIPRGIAIGPLNYAERNGYLKIECFWEMGRWKRWVVVFKIFP